MSFMEGAGGAGDLMNGAANMTNATTNMAQAIVPQDSTVKTTQASNTQTSTQQFVQQVVDQLQKSQGSQIQQGKQQALSDEEQKRLSLLVGNLMGQLLGTEPSQVDFNGIRTAAVNQALEKGIGNVIASGTNQRAYDSSVQGIAAEKLGSRAALEGTVAQAQAKLKEQDQLQNSIAALMNVLKGATATTDNTVLTEQLSQLLGNTQTASQSQETTKSISGSTSKTDVSGLGEELASALKGLETKGKELGLQSPLMAAMDHTVNGGGSITDRLKQSLLTGGDMLMMESINQATGANA